MIESIKYVDEVIEYSTEADLLEILKALNPDVRIIGTDGKGNHIQATNFLLQSLARQRP